MENEQMIIVFGGSSYIGKHICKRFSEQGQLLAGTYCNNNQENMLYFDIKNPNLNTLPINLNLASHAVICSSITKPDDCKKDENNSYMVNVIGTRKLIEQLFQLNIVPVFFSSEYVFNGEKGDYTELDEKHPCTVYGAQKKEIEDFLLQTKKEYLILRLGKVFGLEENDKTILTSTICQLKRNKKIKCATDQLFSPIYIDDLVNSLELALRERLNGLYNLASPEYFSRYRLSLLLKSELNIKSGEIIPCSIKDFNFLDSRPLNTTLNVGKFVNVTGFKFTKMQTCIKTLERLVF